MLGSGPNYHIVFANILQKLRDMLGVVLTVGVHRDDDVAVRNTMNEYIQAAGYISDAVSCAEEAIESLRKDAFHVVITDIILPDMGGLELTKFIKKEKDSDVIVMTGYSDDYSYEEAINIGASDFIIKPIRLEELLLRLKRVLKEHRLELFEQIEVVLRCAGPALGLLEISSDCPEILNSKWVKALV